MALSGPHGRRDVGPLLTQSGHGHVPRGSQLLTLSGSRWFQFGRPPLAGIAAIRWIGCLAGHYLGARRRNRFRLAKYRYPLTRGRLGRSNRLVASRVCATLEMLPNISRAG
jgi:hypothetical protein